MTTEDLRGLLQKWFVKLDLMPHPFGDEGTLQQHGEAEADDDASTSPGQARAAARAAALSQDLFMGMPSQHAQPSRSFFRAGPKAMLDLSPGVQIY